ncbi:hypothetical protein ACF1G0_30145 [Streptomyces sp. NPDC013953]|uniref:hypothetical protein n=1 Tax=Streptomyces sp. NPDC013953 TaxID=3364868 RepID=UPI0036F91C03
MPELDEVPGSARRAAPGGLARGWAAAVFGGLRAVRRQHPGLRLVCADAVDHLRDAKPYDLIYSVSGVPFTDPRRPLPVPANGPRPGGRFVFTALHTNSHGDGPSSCVVARPEVLRLPGTNQWLR